jgi:hypothetical protein
MNYCGNEIIRCLGDRWCSYNSLNCSTEMILKNFQKLNHLSFTHSPSSGFHVTHFESIRQGIATACVRTSVVIIGDEVILEGADVEVVAERMGKLVVGIAAETNEAQEP